MTAPGTPRRCAAGQIRQGKRLCRSQTTALVRYGACICLATPDFRHTTSEGPRSYPARRDSVATLSCEGVTLLYSPPESDKHLWRGATVTDAAAALGLRLSSSHGWDGWVLSVLHEVGCQCLAHNICE